MGNKVKMIFDISNFEPVAEDSENKLVGGFSASVSGTFQDPVQETTNNCQGGNCVKGCGDGQILNGAAGCGTK
ncbi:hypothetical protein [Ascidiimonas sp. W6]|uniref:hypothetical protein n=1 Tax=Ascidiimonas meishanensis TaxID=3128903 RepID=UPI0030EBF2A9